MQFIILIINKILFDVQGKKIIDFCKKIFNFWYDIRVINGFSYNHFSRCWKCFYFFIFQIHSLICYITSTTWRFWNICLFLLLILISSIATCISSSSSRNLSWRSRTASKPTIIIITILTTNQISISSMTKGGIWTKSRFPIW